MWISCTVINLFSIIRHLLFLIFHFYKSHCNEHLCIQLFLITSSGQSPSGIMRSGYSNILTACNICCSFLAVDHMRIFCVQSPNWLILSYLFLKSLSVFGLVFFCQPDIPIFVYLVDDICNLELTLSLLNFNCQIWSIPPTLPISLNL